MNPSELRLFSKPRLVWRMNGFEPSGNGTDHFLGNLNGWVQHRKMVPNESDPLGADA